MDSSYQVIRVKLDTTDVYILIFAVYLEDKPLFEDLNQFLGKETSDLPVKYLPGKYWKAPIHWMNTMLRYLDYSQLAFSALYNGFLPDPIETWLIDHKVRTFAQNMKSSWTSDRVKYPAFHHLKVLWMFNALRPREDLSTVTAYAYVKNNDVNMRNEINGEIDSLFPLASPRCRGKFKRWLQPHLSIVSLEKLLASVAGHGGLYVSNPTRQSSLDCLRCAFSFQVIYKIYQIVIENPFQYHVSIVLLSRIVIDYTSLVASWFNEEKRSCSLKSPIDLFYSTPSDIAKDPRGYRSERNRSILLK